MRVQLTFNTRFHRQFADNRGNLIDLPIQRLTGLVRIAGGPSVLCDCWIDTGAPLSIFPRFEWQRFADRIEWLTAVRRSSTAARSPTRVRVGGSTLQARAGLIPFSVIDADFHESEIRTVAALFASSKKPLGLSKTLIGLGGGFWSGRQFVMKHDRQEAYVEE